MTLQYKFNHVSLFIGTSIWTARDPSRPSVEEDSRFNAKDTRYSCVRLIISDDSLAPTTEEEEAEDGEECFWNVVAIPGDGD